jgi:hypothetical protein
MFVLRLMFPTLTHQVSLHALDVIEVCLRASMRVERMVHITAKGTMETSSGKLQPARPVVSVPTCPLPCVHQLSWFAGLLPWSGGTHLARAGQPVLSQSWADGSHHSEGNHGDFLRQAPAGQTSHEMSDRPTPLNILPPTPSWDAQIESVFLPVICPACTSSAGLQVSCHGLRGRT